MSDSYPFPTYSGLLEPKHYKRIGSAIWLFLWCISSTTKEVEKDGVTWGIVLGNKPVKLNELASHFDVDKKTIQRWIEALEQHEYIRVTRAPYGLIFTVRNSKKYKDRMDKNVHSEEREETNMSTLSVREWTEMSILEDKNVHSNKDITEINNNAAVVIKDQDEILRLAQEIEKHFCMRRGKGFAVSPADFEEIKKMVADGVPLPIIKDCIDKSFAEYKPRHRKDEIRSITYCIPRCYDEWMKRQVTVAEPITGAVPHVPVALGPPIRSKQQRDLDELKRLREEELRREQAAGH